MAQGRLPLPTTGTAFAVVGLGHMGGNLALQAIEKGYTVIGMDRGTVVPDLVAAGVIPAETADELVERLPPPRLIMIYVPAGAAVDRVIDGFAGRLAPGDVVMDGGNSYWGDSLRRHHRLAMKGIGFVDAGTSGGVEGARHGACFMVGGEAEHVARAEPILRRLSVEGGYVHAGGPGAGHFTKLVHNGIEFGMLQAIAEGVSLLEARKDGLAVADILQCWRHGSVIRSWLIDLMAAAYGDRARFGAVPAFVEDTGEVNWLVGDALDMDVPIPVIAQSVMQLLASRDDSKDWARAIALMRRGFGGHPLGPDAHVARVRRTSRVGAPPSSE